MRRRHNFDLKTTVNNIEYHRNGIAGAGFHVVEFTFHRNREISAPDENRDLEMVATVFEEEAHCAVIQPSDLTQKWRGDQFEDQLREAIEEYSDSMAYDESTNPSNGWRAPDEPIFPIRHNH